MKKIILFVLTGLLLFSCDPKKPAVQSAVELTVENTISTDRQDMYINYNNNYSWFETCIVLDNYLDSDTTINVSAVSNIFQYLIEKEDGYDTNVVMFTHTTDTAAVDVKHGAFWIGDCVLNNEEVKLTFKEALDRLMQANCPKPHSRQVVLREELGPNRINPQYIFGNIQEHVYVDAVTGDVNLSNPAFNDDDI
jgi:hypothetical protein